MALVLEHRFDLHVLERGRKPRRGIRINQYRSGTCVLRSLVPRAASGDEKFFTASEEVRRKPDSNGCSQHDEANAMPHKDLTDGLFRMRLPHIDAGVSRNTHPAD